MGSIDCRHGIANIAIKRLICAFELFARSPYHPAHYIVRFCPVAIPAFSEGQLLKLPANKFTVREREMLIGSGILPPEFFAATKNPFVIGVGACEFSFLADWGFWDSVFQWEHIEYQY